MPIAKETLRIGFVVVANEGTYVSKQAVKDNGWEKLVTDGPDIGGTAKSDEDKQAAKK